MARALVTSFEPFGGYEANSSLEVGRVLAKSTPAGVEIDWLVLPVVAGVCVELAWARMEASRPDFVMALGQAGSSPLVRVEDRAVNFDLFHFADNGGNLRLGQPVVPGGPAVLRTPVPILDVLDQVRRGGQRLDHSFSAGSYVCNHLYYQLLHREGPPALFVHLPLLPSQQDGRPGVFALPLEEQAACVREVLRACLVLSSPRNEAPRPG